jgi:plastocyanin
MPRRSRGRSVSKPRRLTAVAVGLGALLGALGPGATAPRPVTHTVVVEATSFEPDTLTVRAGDTVVWVNRDPFPHTATSKVFDSKVIPADGSWKYVVRARGTVPYICTLHPTMKGTLRVE